VTCDGYISFRLTSRFHEHISNMLSLYAFTASNLRRFLFDSKVCYTIHHLPIKHSTLLERTE